MACRGGSRLLAERASHHVAETRLGLGDGVQFALALDGDCSTLHGIADRAGVQLALLGVDAPAAELGRVGRQRRGQVARAVGALAGTLFGGGEWRT